jgi:lipid II:glycine glycyltransferase (peptidoglycan interpeptide bridge formation enzyme)
MEPIAGKRVSAISREMEILRAFAKVLAKERIFVQSFHPTVSNWLPFHWEGFTQVLRFGYVFDDLTDLDMIWSGMERSLRRAIHKAERSGITVVPCESSVVVSLTEKSFRHQRMQLPFGREYFERICQAAKRNDAGECFAAVDMDGKAHAALFLVWDHKRAYSLVGGTDPETRASGANCLLFWHVIKFAASRANMFDFAGTMLEPNEMFVRSFGARLVPYNQIRHMPRMLAAISSLLGSPGMSRLTRLSSDHLHED